MLDLLYAPAKFLFPLEVVKCSQVIFIYLISVVFVVEAHLISHHCMPHLESLLHEQCNPLGLLRVYWRHDLLLQVLSVPQILLSRCELAMILVQEFHRSRRPLIPPASSSIC